MDTGTLSGTIEVRYSNRTCLTVTVKGVTGVTGSLCAGSVGFIGLLCGGVALRGAKVTLRVASNMWLQRFLQVLTFVII